MIGGVVEAQHVGEGAPRGRVDPLARAAAQQVTATTPEDKTWALVATVTVFAIIDTPATPSGAATISATGQ